MSRSRELQSGFFLCFCLLFPALLPSAEIGGSLDGPTRYKVGYRANPSDSGNTEVWTDIDRVPFILNSFNGNYKLVEFYVTNKGTDMLLLSSDKDNIDCIFDNQVVVGLLDFRKEAPDTWKSFDEGMRRQLTYPQFIEPGKTVRIFIFLKNAKINRMPTSFRYKIDSSKTTLELREPGKAAA